MAHTERRPRWLWFLVENSLLLLVGATAALLWVNVDPGSYHSVSESLRFVVNDIGMVFFFAIAAKEVFEATLPGGSLSSPRTSALPLLAAVGGMAGPAALYIALVHWQGVPELLNGWAIPCATDIAFSYLVARRVYGNAHPAVPFLLMLAIVDDALGLLILAIFYPSGPVHLLDGSHPRRRRHADRVGAEAPRRQEFLAVRAARRRRVMARSASRWIAPRTRARTHRGIHATPTARSARADRAHRAIRPTH